MLSRQFQEAGKSDFRMKVKQQRYLGTSLQSTESLELEPALDRAALPRLPPGFPRQQPLSHSGPPVLPAVPAAPPPPASPPHAGDSHSGSRTGKISGDLLPKPDSRRHTLAEESPKGLGRVFSVAVLSPFLSLNFGRDTPCACFSRGLTICSNPFLTLCCSQGSRTRLCFLSLFNS